METADRGIRTVEINRIVTEDPRPKALASVTNALHSESKLSASAAKAVAPALPQDDLAPAAARLFLRLKRCIFRGVAAAFLAVVAVVVFARDPRVGAPTDAPESPRNEPAAPARAPPPPAAPPPRRRRRGAAAAWNFSPAVGAGARLVAAEVEDLVADARAAYEGLARTAAGVHERSYWNEHTFAAFHRAYDGDLATIRSMVWACLRVREFAGADAARAALLDRAAADFGGDLDDALWRDARADAVMPIASSRPPSSKTDLVTVFWVIAYGGGALARGEDLPLGPDGFAAHQVRLFEFRALALERYALATGDLGSFAAVHDLRVDGGLLRLWRKAGGAYREFTAAATPYLKDLHPPMTRRVYVANAPSGFGLIWSVIKMGISKRQVEKVVVLSGDFQPSDVAELDVRELSLIHI